MNLLTDEALTEKQLYRLKDHKYSSSGKSILESKLQPFWNKVVEKVPLWSRFNVHLSFIKSIELFKALPGTPLSVQNRFTDCPKLNYTVGPEHKFWSICMATIL